MTTKGDCMETNVRELKAHLSEYLRRAALGEEVLVTLRGKPLARLVSVSSDATPETLEEASIARLRTLPWITPGNGNKPMGSVNPVRIGPDEKCLAAIVGEMRG
jgi:prevent-host-death family protein